VLRVALVWRVLRAGFWGYFIVRGIFRREHKPESDLDRLLFYMLAGTIIGARLGHCLFYEPAYSLRHPLG